MKRRKKCPFRCTWGCECDLNAGHRGDHHNKTWNNVHLWVKSKPLLRKKRKVKKEE